MIGPGVRGPRTCGPERSCVPACRSGWGAWTVPGAGSSASGRCEPVRAALAVGPCSLLAPARPPPVSQGALPSAVVPAPGRSLRAPCGRRQPRPSDRTRRPGHDRSGYPPGVVIGRDRDRAGSWCAGTLRRGRGSRRCLGAGVAGGPQSRRASSCLRGRRRWRPRWRLGVCAAAARPPAAVPLAARARAAALAPRGRASSRCRRCSRCERTFCGALDRRRRRWRAALAVGGGPGLGHVHRDRPRARPADDCCCWCRGPALRELRPPAAALPISPWRLTLPAPASATVPALRRARRRRAPRRRPWLPRQADSRRCASTRRWSACGSRRGAPEDPEPWPRMEPSDSIPPSCMRSSDPASRATFRHSHRATRPVTARISPPISCPKSEWPAISGPGGARVLDQQRADGEDRRPADAHRQQEHDCR